MNIDQIDGLVQAIYDQCGMRATASKTWCDLGLSVRVQISLVPLPDAQNERDWQFFYAHSEDQLPRLRDELVDFIAENRRRAA